MNTLIGVLLVFSLPGVRFSTPPKAPMDRTVVRHAHKGGTWYFANNGHAVYCYGPVMIVNEPPGGFQRVATFCKGDLAMVPLKD
ncbi:MAG: hypothetical protein NVS1B11_28980 [Terriglobales bacterium]